MASTALGRPPRPPPDSPARQCRRTPHDQCEQKPTCRLEAGELQYQRMRY